MLNTRISLHDLKHVPRKTILAAFIVLFISVPLAYSLYTDHVWEDFFITFKFSKNFCEGNGLVYVPGERVHGFTSPIGTILPAFCYLLTGSDSHEKAVWLFRLLFCIPAFAAAGIFIVKIFLDEESEDHHVIPMLFAALLFAAETKSVVFSVNGMETAFMLFFLSWSFYLITRSSFNWVQIGFAWGGLMWTRPDSCIYIAAITAAYLVCMRRQPLKEMLVPVMKAAAVTTAVYLPWFIWAWWYYGSPVPHTILAKEAMNSSPGAFELLARIITHIHKAASWIYAPVYPHFGGWNPVVFVFSGFAGLFAFAYWMIPWAREDRIGRTASFAFFGVTLYFAGMPFPYPWYFPPVAMLGIIVFARGFFTLSTHFKRKEDRFTVPVIALSGFFLVMTTTLFLTTYEMMLQQNYIENGIRRKVGEWLNLNSGRNDRIYVEALGYIGYFSDRKMLDYPGLVSPEVVSIVRKEHLGYVELVEKLKPEWVVARILDQWNLVCGSAYFKNNYESVAIFDSADAIGDLGYIPGEWYLLYDACYYISRRKDVAGGEPIRLKELPMSKNFKAARDLREDHNRDETAK